MASQKLIRCEVRPQGSTSPGSPRFVPLEIFGLWEYLMTHKHDFDIGSTKRRPGETFVRRSLTRPTRL